MRSMLSLTVTADDDEKMSLGVLHSWFSKLNEEILQAGLPEVSVNLSKLSLDGSDSGEEYFDENTLFKVADAIGMHTATESEAREIINSMQNAGILFRERRP